MIGIYKITNKINNKCYIGQSTNIERRWQEHLAKIPIGTQVLYQAIRKHGYTNFTFEILEECSIDLLDQREVYWSVQYNSLVPNGYNMVECGGSSHGEYNQNSKYSTEQIYYIRKSVYIDLKTPEQVLNEVKDWGMGRYYFYLLLHGDFRTEEGSGAELIHFLRNVGEANSRTQLTNTEVLSIRQRVHINKETQLSVFQDFKDRISFQAFIKIVSGETWQNVDCSMIQKIKVERKGKPKAKLTKEEVGYIRYRHEVLGEDVSTIYKDYDHRVNRNTINRIVKYETWKDVKPVSTIPEA